MSGCHSNTQTPIMASVALSVHQDDTTTATTTTRGANPREVAQALHEQVRQSSVLELKEVRDRTTEKMYKETTQVYNASKSAAVAVMHAMCTLVAFANNTFESAYKEKFGNVCFYNKALECYMCVLEAKTHASLAVKRMCETWIFGPLPNLIPSTASVQQPTSDDCDKYLRQDMANHVVKTLRSLGKTRQVIADYVKMCQETVLVYQNYLEARQEALNRFQYITEESLWQEVAVADADFKRLMGIMQLLYNDMYIYTVFDAQVCTVGTVLQKNTNLYTTKPSIIFPPR